MASIIDAVLNFVETLWLFTINDLKSIVIPTTAFAILAVLSGPLLTTDSSPQMSATLARAPQIVMWTWINLLPFCVDNQRQRNSIEEDAANKPWRPMPSKRLTQGQALKLFVFSCSAAIISSLCLGGLTECLLLMGLGIWYNTFGAGDFHWILRNFINACGFTSFALGATKVAIGRQWTSDPLNPAAKYWFLSIGAVVLSSVQTQDMYDQVGDSIRGRKTLPLVIGDRAARVTIAVSVTFWSICCPTFWSLSLAYQAVSIVFGGVIAYRTLSRRTVPEDKKTFLLWNIWMVMLYLMPLIKRLEDVNTMRTARGITAVMGQ